MDSFYFIIVLALIVLAISDLIVGVSNDAVNFLNSAYGSRVAKKKTILIVAAIGILVGALSSSGMMEIARKGIFNPEMFSFADIMTIFLAVMITDILLLDLFNTFGLPTSTTISIMFELLGAAFIVACIKIIRTEGSFTELSVYLNGRSAAMIIAGIFLSVFIAFTIGYIVQFISRLIFSFNLKQSVKRLGPFFGGLAITTIAYFLLIKGLKGSALIPTNVNSWVGANTGLVLGMMFIFWTSICFTLSKFFRTNILKVVVIFGTFSLAMAFAGNDLVNFIGVPLAGLQAYSLFQTSNVGAEELGMGILGDQLQTNTWILFGAGAIMIGALWFSKKAQSVTETEINLARQNQSNERFKPNLLARLIVRGGLSVNQASAKIIPDQTRNQINSKFKKMQFAGASEEDQPAFDLVRASVNLMTASVLIAFATSLKLPLSTTYVSFMVAMGTSLADRAWSRDAAVYRVAGVIHVITGWLMTAAIAFVGAAVLALMIYFGGMVAIIGLLMLTALLMIRSRLLHKKRAAKSVSRLAALAQKSSISATELMDESRYRISITLFKVSCIIRDVLAGMASEEKSVIQKAKAEVSNFQEEHADLKKSYYYFLQKTDSNSGDEARFYMHALNHLDHVSQAVQTVSESIFNHLHNLHQPATADKISDLNKLTDKMSDFLMEMSDYILADDVKGLKTIRVRNEALFKLIDELETRHIITVKEDKTSPINSLLYVTILMEYRNILMHVNGLFGLFQRPDENPPPKAPRHSSVLN